MVNIEIVDNRRLARLCEEAGLKAIAYGYRHGFATVALASVDGGGSGSALGRGG